MHKRLISIFLCIVLTAIFTFPTYAVSDIPLTNDEYTIEQFDKDLKEFFENQGSVELAPGQTYKCNIPLSNGDIAEWECGAFSLTPPLGRGVVDAEYNTGLGNNGFYNRVRYDLFGSFSHRIYINVTSTSPTCMFTIYSNEVIDPVPAPLNSFVSSSAQTLINYSSGNSSMAQAYATFKPLEITGANVNIYSKILANSYKAGIMNYTCYFQLTPFS